MMKRRLALVGTVLLSGVALATPEEDHADAIRVLGVTNIVVKNPGYFFYGGEYIQPPYVVTREGDFLKINGRYIRFFCKWPQPEGRKWHVTHKMPEIPATIDETTSEFEQCVQDYMDDCFDYWLTTRKDGDKSMGGEAIVAGMLKLPCVKDAYVTDRREAKISWKADTHPTVCDYSYIIENPSCWDPKPVDPKAFMAGGDEAAVDLAGEISNGRYLFWPAKGGNARLSGHDLEPEFVKVLKNLDKCATGEELAAACGGPWYAELCADILKHKDSFDARLRKRIDSRVAEIESAARAGGGEVRLDCHSKLPE